MGSLGSPPGRWVGPGRMAGPEPVLGDPEALPCRPDRLDQLPFAHARAAGDLELPGLGVQLGPVAVFEIVTRASAPRASARRLATEVPLCGPGQVRDRAPLGCRLLRLLDVPLRGGGLLLR